MTTMPPPWKSLLAALAVAVSTGCSQTAAGNDPPPTAPPVASEAAAPTPASGPLTVPETPWWQQAASTAGPATPSGPAEPRRYVLDGGVLFGPDAADLTVGAGSQLAALLDQVADPGSAQFAVDGFVNDDGTGDPQTADALSTARAQAVQAWLVDHGVPPEHITVQGWGASRPVYPEPVDELQRAANRRCEITVTG